ncbi:MAG: molecular chaperone HtpG [Candidatus Cloacimonadota bacterium]|nr:MAG: molecular chaperone HtpG [Candidatus Cloacimonadota bacterium]RLC51768.1 MAG: molecular chaperone HtpG [Candidatus Cloacimonadota bacterium]
MAEKKANPGKLSIHTENIFPIIKKWLYSEHDIFLRELISNAIDAMSKRKALNPEIDEKELKVEVKINKKKKTIQIIDAGIGMNATEVKKYINQIAFSGAEDFVEKFKDKQNSIIGHFGLGFYSSFMVADKVTIDTLSYKANSKPVFWECEGETEYTMTEGKRKKVGTTVTVHVNKESEQYLEESKLKELIEKYSNFMPYPIKLGKEVVNQKEALWLRKPKDVTEEEYKEFYKSLFHDWQDPLFWIHLNVDFPFNLKGILYFPKIKNQLEVNTGKVKLFCNNVFVADDLKGIIPEFLLLLKGGIDIPDIPLNVSRSFLQQDQQVTKISQFIIKKVGDSLKSIFKEDRKKYEELWEDINQFIKYGMLTDEKFADSMREFVIFKTTQGDYVTIQEYRDRNKSDDKPQKIFYAGSEDTQITYLNMMKEQGIEVIYSNSVLDNHLYQNLEMKNSEITFVRIDSEINDTLVEKDKAEVVDANNRTISEKVIEIFNKTLNDKIEAGFNKDDYAKFIKAHPEAINILAPYIRTKDDFTHIKPYDIPTEVRKKIGEEAFKEIMDKVYLEITTEIKYLKAKEIPAMIVFNEFMRRYQEMNQLQSPGGDMDMLKNHNLIVNPDNDTIKKIVEFYDNNEIEKAELLVNYIHELAMLEQKRFSGKELQSFLEKANKVLGMIG